MALRELVAMGNCGCATFGVKWASDESFCSSTTPQLNIVSEMRTAIVIKKIKNNQ